MKRPIFVLLATTALVGLLALAANTLVARGLDAALPGLLENALGMPVRLAPMTVNLLRMQASSDEFVLGEAAAPVAHARGVTTRLAPGDLLRGKLRFLSASADSLSLAVWRWPETGEPAAQDYLWLDQWLPDAAVVEALRLIPEEGANTLASSLHWIRESSGGAALSGRFMAGPTAISLSTRLNALRALLGLESAAFSLHAEAAGQPGSGIDLQGHFLPGTGGGYSLDAALAASGLQAHLRASSAQSWQVPTESDIEIRRLQAGKLQELVTLYRPPDESRSLDAMLDTAVPRLTLPAHAATIRITEFRQGGFVLTNTGVSLNTHADGLAVEAFHGSAPEEARLHTAAHVDTRSAVWRVTLEAGLEAGSTARATDAARDQKTDSATGLMAAYAGERWQLDAAVARLTGNGGTWGELLYSLAGSVRASGTYAAASEVPIALQFELDNRPDEFTVDNFVLQLGEGRVSGRAGIAGKKPRHIGLTLRADNLDLSYFEHPDTKRDSKAITDIAPPAALSLFDELQIDATLTAARLRSGGLEIASAEASFKRDARHTALNLQAKDSSGGEYNLTLDAGAPDTADPAFRLRARLDNADLRALLQATGLPHSRTTGSLAFTGPSATGGRLPREVAAQADLVVALRADDNWQRASAGNEDLRIIADARLTTDRDRFQSLEVDQLSVTGVGQDLTGSVSVTAGEPPVIAATLASQNLNLDTLRALLPAEKEDAEGATDALLQAVRRLDHTRISYSAERLTFRELPLDQFRLELIGSPNVIDVARFDLNTRGGQFGGKANVRWRGEQAILDASARLENMNLDQFLWGNPAEEGYPVSGRIQVNSEGGSDSEFLSNLNGSIQLAASEGSAAGKPARRRIDAQVSRLAGGAQLNVNTLVWGDTDLAGRLTYQAGDPARLAIEIDGGTLSLAPWVKTAARTAPQREKNAANTVAEVAVASAGFIGDFVLSPLSSLAGNEEASPGERVFSAEPLPLDTLDALDLAVSGRLDTLNSPFIDADDVAFAITVKEKAVSATINAGAVNGGQADFDLTFNTGTNPPQLSLESHFSGTRVAAGKDSFPSSGFLSLSSEGRSSAELAANSNGLFYIEMGRGPLDYSARTLLNADVATALVRALIPGMEKQTSEMECGVALFQARNGIVATPYGMVARTSLANLVGRAQVDLQKEQLRIKLDSRSRKGVGLSVSSIFANTIEIRGPLSAPEIEPDTSSILWRSWAAVMTAGLSVVGESVLKRALASENPCVHVKDLIHEDFCTRNNTAAASPLVCPTPAA